MSAIAGQHHLDTAGAPQRIAQFAREPQHGDRPRYAGGHGPRRDRPRHDPGSITTVIRPRLARPAFRRLSPPRGGRRPRAARSHGRAGSPRPPGTRSSTTCARPVAGSVVIAAVAGARGAFSVNTKPAIFFFSSPPRAAGPAVKGGDARQARLAPRVQSPKATSRKFQRPRGTDRQARRHGTAPAGSARA